MKNAEIDVKVYYIWLVGAMLLGAMLLDPVLPIGIWLVPFIIFWPVEGEFVSFIDG